MTIRTRTTLLLTVALIAALVLADRVSAAPPTLGVLRDSGVLASGVKAKKLKKLSDTVTLGGVHKPGLNPGSHTLLPGVQDLIPGPNNLIPGPGPVDPPESGGGGAADPPDDPPHDVPSNPDWMDIVEGIGGILNGGGHGGHPGHHPGHHPGSHPGHYPGHYPDYIPGYPTPGTSGSSYVPSNPLPEAPVEAGQAVVVANPAKNGASISFLAGGRQYTLAPGYQQVVKQSGKIEVRFDRGGPFGTARYTLQDGVFQFLVTDDGWNLFRKVYRITLDNTANPFPFRYLVGNTLQEVPANSTKDYEENEPLVVRFDPGTGQAATRTLDTGTYRIAVNPALRLWELQEVGTEAGIPEMASNLPPSAPMPME